MCGIVGLAGQYDLSWPARMSQALGHRGPDDAGVFEDRPAGVALAMRRLSIIDVVGGHQPMSNAGCLGQAKQQPLWIVYNGELFNAPVLRRILESQGHTFTTSHADTEVLLHLYEQHGPRMVQELNGMFAFIIYDQARQRLFAARDHAGIKPLYYTQQPAYVAFASELKGLLPCVSRQIDQASLFHYMSLLYIPGEGSILAGVKRLPPAHALTYDLRSRQLTVRPYWELDVQHPEPQREAVWRERLREALRDAVRRWTMSDVPIACSLSGGIDSAALVGLLHESGHANIRTYSLGFAGEEAQPWNELPLARQVAQRWGTDHHELIVEPEDLLRDLVQMVWHLDEPYGGGLPSWYVFQHMSQDVKVGLTGTGGDELFGNYGKFQTLETNLGARIARALQPTMSAPDGSSVRQFWKPVARLAGALPDRWVGSSRKQLLAEFPMVCRQPLRRYYFDIRAYFADVVKRDQVFQSNVDSRCETWAALQRWYDQARTRDVRDGIAYLDFKTQLAEEFLLMTDRFSMAHSLEARVPYLDRELVELVFRIPSSMRTQRDDVKRLFKRAIGDLVPPSVLGAKKRGFVLPIQRWLRQPLRPLVERLCHPDRLQAQGVFRPSFYRQYVEPHLEGRADHTWRVWAVLMFQLWHLVFIEEQASSVPAFSWRQVSAN